MSKTSPGPFWPRLQRLSPCRALRSRKPARRSGSACRPRPIGRHRLRNRDPAEAVREGRVDAELTIYRGGAEGFEAIAAGAADLILNSSSSVAAASRRASTSSASPTARMATTAGISS